MLPFDVPLEALVSSKLASKLTQQLKVLHACSQPVPGSIYLQGVNLAILLVGLIVHDHTRLMVTGLWIFEIQL